jgi:hypothetical protein
LQEVAVEANVSGLTVSLNRSGLNTVETDRDRVQSADDVLVSLENHGKPTHVHLHLDDDLAALGTIEDPHWFVPQGERRDVPLQLTDGAAGEGRLEITAGYGQAQTTVTVEARVAEEADSTPSPASSLLDDAGTDTPEDQPASETAGLRNPMVLGAGGSAALVVFLWLLTDPLVALSVGLVALLSGLAVASYYSGWTPFSA